MFSHPSPPCPRYVSSHLLPLPLLSYAPLACMLLSPSPLSARCLCTFPLLAHRCSLIGEFPLRSSLPLLLTHALSPCTPPHHQRVLILVGPRSIQEDARHLAVWRQKIDSAAAVQEQGTAFSAGASISSESSPSLPPLSSFLFSRQIPRFIVSVFRLLLSFSCSLTLFHTVFSRGRKKGGSLLWRASR